MKVKGIIPGGEYDCGLRHNSGFTLPANIGQLGDDITVLDLSYCSLRGPLSTRTELLRILLTICALFAGELPKHFPLSLETLQFGPDEAWHGNSNKFEGGIPAEWGSLTNLKKLNVMKCGLDGKPLSIRTEYLCFVLIFFDFQVLCRGVVPGRVPKELAKLANLTTLYLHKNEGLQVPEGAPLDFDGDMHYDDHEKVAAFQVCLN